MNGYGVRRQAKRDAALVSKGKRRRASLATALYNFVSDAQLDLPVWGHESSSTYSNTSRRRLFDYEHPASQRFFSSDRELSMC